MHTGPPRVSTLHMQSANHSPPRHRLSPALVGPSYTHLHYRQLLEIRYEPAIFPVPAQAPLLCLTMPSPHF